MPDFYALTGTPLPKRLHGKASDCSIRRLSSAERLAIEDYLFHKSGDKRTLSATTTAIVVSHMASAVATLEDRATLAEFGLAIMTTSGFQPVEMAASLSEGACVEAINRPSLGTVVAPPVFAKRVTGIAASTWLWRLFTAGANSRNRIHITADRFVRYSRTLNVDDSLMDLCISLESLIDGHTEVSFRFGTCLAKVTGEKGKNAEEIAKLLSDLYDMRSKVVHGADATKERQRMKPHLPFLRATARRILTDYVLFMSERSRNDWATHIRTLLFQ